MNQAPVALVALALAFSSSGCGRMMRTGNPIVDVALVSGKVIQANEAVRARSGALDDEECCEAEEADESEQPHGKAAQACGEAAQARTGQLVAPKCEAAVLSAPRPATPAMPAAPTLATKTASDRKFDEDDGQRPPISP